MRHWRDVLTLQWLSGEDDRPAYWKMAHVANMLLLLVVVVGCFVEGTLSACIGWLFAWAVLLAFSSHSIKGLQLYRQAKVDASLNTAASVSTAIEANIPAIIEAVKAKGKK